MVVVEELDPVLEEDLRLLGIACEGKSVFPLCGELDPTVVRKGAAAAGRPVDRPPVALPALAALDSVTLFDEPDPYRVIQQLQPDVLVKGGDWPIEKIIGRDVVEARGGRVVNVPFVEGQSTTGIIEKILKVYGR